MYLNTLGQSIPEPKKINTIFGRHVKGYADNIRQQYRDQPIVATNWPPRIQKFFFGRLALVEKQDSSTQAESAWHMLRGQVAETVKLTENNEISVEDVLQPTDSSLSLRVVIDGPPGIGKTTLCRKLLNMWSNGPLVHQQYDLVLYCPLRDSKIATATTLADLFVHQRHDVPMVAGWFEKRNGKGLLLIFDGWDELREQLRQSSLAASIIDRKQLDQCSVIVTSRSYASSSLLKMDTLSRHVQVIGFFKEEISTVIIQSLQKDTKLAQELIDKKREDDKNHKPFTTTQSSEDSQLAVKLINDLTVRNDVQLLCYVPLVCSMVILVYRKEGGHLPTTLTQLYENFILQTIRRHVEIKSRHDIDPYTLGSLSSLPSQLAKPLQEMCQLAYTNLANTTMTFSSDQLQSLSEAAKEDYLGLMTRFMEYSKKKYQFLHLSIQEFLAAWWIAKHEKKREEVFKDHFDDDHFRMCLRFVAGLTHLQHESYQQYFNKQQLDLQCKREPLFGFETCHLSYFYQNPEIRQNFDHISSDDLDNVPILLLQLLYESQNTTLCQVLAQSINNHSLCQYGVSLSLFDWLCLSYCINNSNTTWNDLHLYHVPNQSLSVFTAGLTNNSLQTQCKRLEVELYEPTDELIHKLLQSSLLYNIQECYCVLSSGQYVLCLVLLEFLNLPQLKVLHLIMGRPTIPTVDNTYYTDKCTELEKCIEMNSTLQEMKIEYIGENETTSTITSAIIRGVTRNKTITSLTIMIRDGAQAPPPPLPDGVIEQLLKDNNTLQALSLNISDELLPSSLNIVEVNTPLTALEIGGWWSSKLMTSFLPHIKGLHCLILHELYLLDLLFFSYPSLHTLTLPLDTAESVIELFTILQTNTTLKALSLKIKEERVYTSSMGTSLQDMLTQNQTLKYLEIDNHRYMYVPSSFLSFLTTGFRHNTSLQQLSVSIPLNEEIRTFINVISQKNNLTELKVNFRPDQSYSNCSYEEKKQIMTPLFYEQVLPAVTNMLQSHTTIRLLRIVCEYINKESSQPNWIELVQHLYETIFIHPSLEYNQIYTGYTPLGLLMDIFNDQKKTLIDHRHRKIQPLMQLLIVINSTAIFCDNFSAIEFEESLKNALKEDFLKYNVSTAIVQGEARVGKTCLKSLILSLPYDSISTPVIEAPFVAFGNFFIDCYGSCSTKGKCWTPVSDDEMDDKVVAELQKHALDKGNKINTKASRSMSQELSKNEENVLPYHATLDDSVETTQQSMETVEINDYQESESESNNVIRDDDVVDNNIADQQSSSISDNVSTHRRKFTSISPQSFNPLEYCKKWCQIDKFGSHREWLYFIDSGGQLQFQKLLLAFMPHTSVLILVVNLSKNLSDKSCTLTVRQKKSQAGEGHELQAGLDRSSTLTQCPGETVDSGNDYSLKVEDMLKQILSAVASNAQKVSSIIDDFPWIEKRGGKLLNVLTVGTHFDKYNKKQESEVESLEEKRDGLRMILNSVSKSIQTVYALPPPRQNPIHVIDGRKAESGEFDDKSVEVIATCLKDQSYEVKVPLRWHYFGVILRKQSKETSGILDLSSCEDFGEMLQMKPQDVHNALKFFHILKMLFYYDDSPAKDIVFVKLDGLISIIKELMDTITDFRKMKGLERDIKQLATVGCISIEYLKSTDSFKKMSSIFKNNDDLVSKMLLDLFRHLDIAAQLSETEFLMPALLPLIDISDTEVATLETTPLLFYFKDRAVPMGLFCAVIVNLLSADSWRITSRQGNYSNFFTLQKTMEVETTMEACQIINLTLVEQLDCIEMHCEETADRVKAKDAVEKSIRDVMEKKNIDDELPILAFYCLPQCGNGRDHKVTKMEDGIICEETNQDFQTNAEYCSWFTSQQDKSDNCESKYILYCFYILCYRYKNTYHG